MTMVIKLVATEKAKLLRVGDPVTVEGEKMVVDMVGEVRGETITILVCPVRILSSAEKVL